MSDDGTATACDYCEYEWNYSGDLAKATCPSCQRKTTVGTDD